MEASRQDGTGAEPERDEVHRAVTGTVPGAAERAEIEEWFARYDRLSARSAPEDIEAMADMAMFPMNLVTDDSAGQGSAEVSDREGYVRSMSEVMGGGTEHLEMEQVRTPFFLTPSLAVVFTRGTMNAGGHRRDIRYADILVKRDGAWRFQTMVQGGWGDAAAAG
ncbi:nuclear transport factor 2 family protein [Allonocardiopsis opalescens]|uniref:SnoaL-like protein n=1 Tax=Allonocardiopsis opalescens TaxID=1144618 RepID=A0A2T0QE93_9ACTN|nr:nuclear transport factor 2 family protein [Allonocardiopsis opalescens]PRY02264.1 hypothetical protein CLV72_101865 [Allonocardiopsis opalescens]